MSVGKRILALGSAIGLLVVLALTAVGSTAPAPTSKDLAKLWRGGASSADSVAATERSSARHGRTRVYRARVVGLTPIEEAPRNEFGPGDGLIVSGRLVRHGRTVGRFEVIQTITEVNDRSFVNLDHIQATLPRGQIAGTGVAGFQDVDSYDLAITGGLAGGEVHVDFRQQGIFVTFHLALH